MVEMRRDELPQMRWNGQIGPLADWAAFLAVTFLLQYMRDPCDMVASS